VSVGEGRPIGAGLGEEAVLLVTKSAGAVLRRSLEVSGSLVVDTSAVLVSLERFELVGGLLERGSRID